MHDVNVWLFAATTAVYGLGYLMARRGWRRRLDALQGRLSQVEKTAFTRLSQAHQQLTDVQVKLAAMQLATKRATREQPAPKAQPSAMDESILRMLDATSPAPATTPVQDVAPWTPTVIFSRQPTALRRVSRS